MIVTVIMTVYIQVIGYFECATKAKFRSSFQVNMLFVQDIVAFCHSVPKVQYIAFWGFSLLTLPWSSTQKL